MKKSLSILCLAASVVAASAGSFQVSIPAGVDYPIGWSFQNKTVSQAFPTAWDSTTLYFWHPSVQNWYTVTWSDLFGGWSDPNYTITNGVGFLWGNDSGAERTITVSGNDITPTSVTRTFTAGNWYLIADNYYRTNTVPFMECVYEISTGRARYTTTSLDYSSHTNDIVSIWVPLLAQMVTGVRSATTSCDFFPFWEAQTPSGACDNAWGSWTSPAIYPGQGFWFKPSTNVTWTIPKVESTCVPGP